MRKSAFYFAAVLIFISASRVSGEVTVDSRSLNIKERGRINEFIGDVVIKGRGFSVFSERALSDTETGVITAEGNVDINYSSGTFSLDTRSLRARIDDGKKKFYLSGEVRSLYTSDEAPPVLIYSDSVEISYSEPRRALFEGSVRTESGELEITSREAFYREDYERIDFTGDPEAWSDSEEGRVHYRGDLIRVYVQDEKISIEGRARTRVWLEDEPGM